MENLETSHQRSERSHYDSCSKGARQKKGARRLSVGSSAVLVIVNSVISTHTRSLVSKQYSPSGNTNMKMILKCYSNFQANNVANNTSKSNNKYSRHMGIQA